MSHWIDDVIWGGFTALALAGVIALVALRPALRLAGMRRCRCGCARLSPEPGRPVLRSQGHHAGLRHRQLRQGVPGHPPCWRPARCAASEAGRLMALAWNKRGKVPVAGRKRESRKCHHRLTGFFNDQALAV
jgi:hypothetical protein